MIEEPVFAVTVVSTSLLTSCETFEAYSEFYKTGGATGDDCRGSGACRTRGEPALFEIRSGGLSHGDG